MSDNNKTKIIGRMEDEYSNDITKTFVLGPIEYRTIDGIKKVAKGIKLNYKTNIIAENVMKKAAKGMKLS